MPYSDKIVDAVCFVVSTNDVILNRSCRDMKVETSYVKSLHKIGLLNGNFLRYNTVGNLKLTIFF